MEALFLDISIVAVVAISMIICAVNGFAYSIVSLAGKLAALAVSLTFCNPVAIWIFNAFLKSNIVDMVRGRILEFASTDELITNIETFANSLPSWMSGSLKIEGIPLGDWIASLAGRLDINALSEAIVSGAMQPVIVAMLGIITFFVIFTVLSFASSLLASAMKLVNKVPIMGKINALLGAVIGVVQGTVFVFLIALALRFGILISGDKLPFIAEKDIDDTVAFRYFYSATIGSKIDFSQN